MSSHRKKILQILPYTSLKHTGGAPRSALSVARLLLDRGIDVEMMVPAEALSNDLGHRVRELNIPVLAVSRLPWCLDEHYARALSFRERLSLAKRKLSMQLTEIEIKGACSPLLPTWCTFQTLPPFVAYVAGAEKKTLYPWNIPTSAQCIAQFGYFLAKLLSFDPTDGIDMTHTTSADCLRGALFMIDCDRFASIGGYDENIVLYHEETVLGIKAKRAGLNSYFCPKSTYLHAVSGPIDKVTDEIGIRKHYLRSLSYLVKEYYGFNHPKRLLCKAIGSISLPVYALRGFKNKLTKYSLVRYPANVLFLD